MTPFSVLSFDVGIKNLGACHLRLSDRGAVSIADWRVLDIGPGADGDLVKSCIAAMDAAFGGLDEAAVDLVAIENQPGLVNPKMKSVQAVIHAFFAMRRPGTPVVYVAASGKIKTARAVTGAEAPPRAKRGQAAAAVEGGGAPKRTSYRDGKKVVIEAAEVLLRAWGLDADLAAMRAHRKKDDLCDAFLQGVGALGGRLVLPQGAAANSTVVDPCTSS